MAEELYFFKLDKKLAVEKLLNLMLTEHEFSFKNYLSKNTNNDSENYDTILLQVENDITLLSQNNLIDIFYWISENNERSLYPSNDYKKYHKILIEELHTCGMDLFSQITSKTQVRAFHDIMSDYENKEAEDSSLPFNCSAKELTDFLDYFICFTGELSIFLHNTYYHRSDYSKETKEIKQLIKEINLRSDGYYHNLALSQLKNEHQYNFETVKLSEKVRLLRQANKNKGTYTLSEGLSEISQRESALITRAGMLYYAIELREKLSKYNGTIVRLHSY